MSRFQGPEGAASLPRTSLTRPNPSVSITPYRSTSGSRRRTIVTADLDDTAKLVSKNTFAQIAAADQWTVVSADAADTTQTVSVWYGDASDNLFKENLSLNGTTRVESTATAKYIVAAYLDAEAAGAVTIERSNTPTFTDIGSISIGDLDLQVGQWFTGSNPWGLVQVRAQIETTAREVNFEVRWYPDDADCLDSADGFRTLGELMCAFTADTTNSPQRMEIPNGMIVLPAGGWLAMFADASDDDTAGTLSFDVVQLT